MLPKDFPPYSTVQRYFQAWRSVALQGPQLLLCANRNAPSTTLPQPGTHLPGLRPSQEGHDPILHACPTVPVSSQAATAPDLKVRFNQTCLLHAPRRAASAPASSIAATKLVASAIPIPAMSNAVP
ncbi:hypothetical protein CCS01_16665 [Rhodopila globiformis]|uniref:Uncharacterized protein n=1 Tax=Rhodopila globiformis TaxID=1071 RepID=A0A2S6NB56_RHOGL|nr:hypothetical protein CCS01_16665 [Rhodopila globiformis]